MLAESLAACGASDRTAASAPSAAGVPTSMRSCVSEGGMQLLSEQSIQPMSAVSTACGACSVSSCAKRAVPERVPISIRM